MILETAGTSLDDLLTVSTHPQRATKKKRLPTCEHSNRLNESPRF